MLISLSITNMLLIEHVELRFGAGLNVLTGETGAGKSILLDSLGFVLGRRGRAEMVRQGAEQGEVSAVFELASDHQVAAIMEQAGLGFDGQLLLRRINYPDGRKRAFVNDRACSTEILRNLGSALVEVHGQHDDRGLLDPKGHRKLLDIFAENESTTEKTAKLWRVFKLADKALEAAKLDIEKAEADAEYVEHAFKELDMISPKTGEDEILDSKRRLMQSADRVRGDVEKAQQAIGVEGAEGQLIDALRWLQDASETPELALEGPIETISQVMIELGELQAGVEAVLNRLDVDPYELEQVEERLFAIRALARKYKVLPDELPALLEDFRQKSQALSEGGATLETLAVQREKNREAYNETADALRVKRIKSAGRLDKAMRAELAPLKMENAIFETVVESAEAGPTGIDNVYFRVATNPGAPMGAIEKIASGGELSRFLLALKVCLTTGISGQTLIFDEIDRGVGGATADAVGRRLASVACEAQVLVVTHSPQVAAMGQTHFVVSKAVRGGVTRTDVLALADEQRRDEIARMLAGDVISDAAKAAAQALLESAPVAAH